MASDSVSLNVSSSSEGDDKVKLVPKKKEEKTFWNQLHWTRIFFVSLGITCLICAIAYFSNLSVPNILVGFFLLVTTGVGFALIWNYAVTKSLAESAESLEKIVLATEEQLEMQKQNNAKTKATTASLEQTNTQLSQRLELFEKTVSVLGDEVKGLQGLEGKMGEMMEANAVVQARREDLSFKQRLFLLQQQIDDLNRDKDDIKRKVRDQFDEADRDHSGYIDDDKEVSKMKEFLGSVQVQWDAKWDADGDGKLERYEVMEGLEKILEDDFAKRRNALLAQKQAEEARAAAFRATAKGQLPAEKK